MKTLTIAIVDYQRLLDSHLRMRGKLLEWAAQCKPCGGTGLTTVQVEIEGEPLYERVEDCAECLDIRSALE